MANVQLPSVNLQEQDTGKLLKQLINAYIMLTEELTFLLNNLDTRNINELNADIINAGTINAALVKIQTALMNGGFIAIDDEGMTVNDGTRDTMKVGLDGKPIMTGAEIRSKEGYPSVIMDPDNELFGAYYNINNSVNIQADYGNAPSLIFINNGIVKGRLSTLLGTLLLDAVDQFEINVTNNGFLRLPRLTNILSADGSNLGFELDSKATAGVSTQFSGAHNHGIPDGTVLRTADGGTVTFFAAPSHTHEQAN